MAYKKQILEKYKKMSENDLQYNLEDYPHKTNKFDNIDDIICENKTIVIHNSTLKYKNINFITENILLQEKLKQKHNCDTMNWEIIEEMKFCEWLYDKENGIDICVSKNTHKRKSDVGVNVTHTQQNKKVKVIEETHEIQETHETQSYNKTEEKEKDVVVIYDSDKTDTDDDEDNIHNENNVIDFYNDYDLINGIRFISSSTKI